MACTSALQAEHVPPTPPRSPHNHARFTAPCVRFPITARVHAHANAALAGSKVKNGVQLAASGVARPQDSFPVPVDNSNTPWRPSLAHLVGLTATPIDLELYKPSKDAGKWRCRTCAPSYYLMAILRPTVLGMVERGQAMLTKSKHSVVPRAVTQRDVTHIMGRW